jgi:GDPmannose 4,6-dehydratase
VKKALITGITGQDGSYLSELLLSKGYEVHGIIRKASSFNTARVSHLYADPNQTDVRFFIHYGDLGDTGQLTHLLYSIEPDEIYHLGAQSHVRTSFDLPELTGDITGLGTLRILEAIRQSGIRARMYQASSSEMFGDSPPPQSETTPLRPRSPYAAAKVFSYWSAVNYREAYGMHVSNGILFNHESPRRGETFLTRKVTRAVAAIMAGRQDKLFLGNLDAKRDWGFAPEYVEFQWRILQHDESDDFVIGMGESYSVREFVETAFGYVGLDWNDYVDIAGRYLRPTEVDWLEADCSKARERLGWDPKIGFEALVQIMIDADMEAIGLEAPGKGTEALKKAGLDWMGTGTADSVSRAHDSVEQWEDGMLTGRTVFKERKQGEIAEAEA